MSYFISFLVHFSGQGTGGPCPSDDSWTFDKSSKEWTELNRCATPKVSSAMALLPLGNSTEEKVVLWGGNTDERTVLVVSTTQHFKGKLNPIIKFVLFERTFKITE